MFGQVILLSSSYLVKEIIGLQYTEINHFKNGIARMEIGSVYNPKPVYINTKCEVVSEK
jgi:hypothetical protein